MIESWFSMRLVVENRFVVNFFTIHKLNAKMLLFQKRKTQRRISQCFKNKFIPIILLQNKEFKNRQFFYGMNRMAYSWVKYRRKPFVKIKTARLWRYVYDVGVLHERNMLFLKSNIIKTTQPNYSKYQLLIKYMILNLIMC